MNQYAIRTIFIETERDEELDTDDVVGLIAQFSGGLAHFLDQVTPVQAEEIILATTRSAEIVAGLISNFRSNDPAITELILRQLTRDTDKDDMISMVLGLYVEAEEAEEAARLAAMPTEIVDAPDLAPDLSRSVNIDSMHNWTITGRHSVTRYHVSQVSQQEIRGRYGMQNTVAASARPLNLFDISPSVVVPADAGANNYVINTALALIERVRVAHLDMTTEPADVSTLQPSSYYRLRGTWVALHNELHLYVNEHSLDFNHHGYTGTANEIISHLTTGTVTPTLTDADVDDVAQDIPSAALGLARLVVTERRLIYEAASQGSDLEATIGSRELQLTRFVLDNQYTLVQSGYTGTCAAIVSQLVYQAQFEGESPEETDGPRFISPNPGHGTRMGVPERRFTGISIGPALLEQASDGQRLYASETIGITGFPHLGEQG